VLPLILGYDTALQFDLPPSCHANWRGLCRQIMDSRADELNVLIRVFMVENEKGFIDFKILGYVDQLVGVEGLALIKQRASQPDIAGLARHEDQPIDPQSWRPELAGEVPALTPLPAPIASTYTAPATYTPPTVPVYAAPPQAAVSYTPPAPVASAPIPVYTPPGVAMVTNYAPPQAPVPHASQPMAIEPDPVVTPKKRGRPAKAAKEAAPEPAPVGPATQTPDAGTVMAGYGMTPAHAVGEELQSRIANALNMQVPPRS
jgi:hypothetical protein